MISKDQETDSPKQMSEKYHLNEEELKRSIVYDKEISKLDRLKKLNDISLLQKSKFSMNDSPIKRLNSPDNPRLK